MSAFNPIVTRFPSCRRPDEPQLVPLSEIVAEIRSDRHAPAMSKIRQAIVLAGDDLKAAKRRARPHKERLPCFSMTGSFTRHADEAWTADNGLAQVDVDGLDAGQVEDLFQRLAVDPVVCFMFRSPSGRGLKIGIRTTPLEAPIPAHYTEKWRMVSVWLKNTYGVENDESTKDCGRLAFIGHDPDMHYNPECVPLDLAAVQVDAESPIDMEDLFAGKGDSRPLAPAPVASDDAAALDAACAAENAKHKAERARNREPVQTHLNTYQVETLAAAHIAKIKSIDGEHGSDALMVVLRDLVDGFSIDPKSESFFRIVRGWNAACATPPWSDKELGHALDSVVAEPPKGTRGWLLPEDRRPIVFRSHADRLRERENPPDMLIDGLLPVGGLGAMVALPGRGKSLLSAEMARCVAAGEPFAGHAVTAGRVVYACPDSPASTERRLLAIPPEVAVRILSVADLPPMPGCLPDLRAAIVAANADGDPVRLLVVDTWDSARSHATDGWAGQDALVETIMRELRSMAADLSLAVVVTHHATRADNGRARGSVVFDARADFIGLADSTGGSVTLDGIKVRDGEAGPVGQWTIQPVAVGGKSVPTLVQVDAAVADFATQRKAASRRADALVLLGFIAKADKATMRGMREATGWGGSKLDSAIDYARSEGWLIPDRLALSEAGQTEADLHLEGVENHHGAKSTGTEDRDASRDDVLANRDGAGRKEKSKRPAGTRKRDKSGQPNSVPGVPNIYGRDPGRDTGRDTEKTDAEREQQALSLAADLVPDDERCPQCGSAAWHPVNGCGDCSCHPATWGAEEGGAA
jgi:hypothetical protein